MFLKIMTILKSAYSLDHIFLDPLVPEKYAISHHVWAWLDNYHLTISSCWWNMYYSMICLTKEWLASCFWWDYQHCLSSWFLWWHGTSHARKGNESYFFRPRKGKLWGRWHFGFSYKSCCSSLNTFIHRLRMSCLEFCCSWDTAR